MSSNICRGCMGTGGIGRLETCSECKGTGKDPLYIEPSASDPVKKYRFKGAAGEYVYSGDFDKAQAEIERLKLVEEVWKLQKHMPAAMIGALDEIERLKKVVNFKDAVACVFDYLKYAAANTSDKSWDDQLEDLAENVIEFAPEYKKQWKDIGKLSADLRSANADKEAYAQNAIDLRRRLEEAIEMLYETSIAHSRIEKILIK